MGWIRVDHGLLTKPEMFAMADRLSLPVPHVAGLCIAFWMWCDLNCLGDNLPVNVTRAMVDRIVQHPGFADALLAAGWLSGEDGSMTVPHFERYNGQSAKKNALAQQRQQRWRNRERPSVAPGNASSVTPTQSGALPDRQDNTYNPPTPRSPVTVDNSPAPAPPPPDQSEPAARATGATSAPPGGKPTARLRGSIPQDWQQSEPGTKRVGELLDKPSRPGEAMPDYRARLRAELERLGFP